MRISTNSIGMSGTLHWSWETRLYRHGSWGLRGYCCACHCPYDLAMTWDDEISTEIRSVSFSRWYRKYSPVEVVNFVCDMPIDL
jgi:hypothetical protein